MYALTIHFEYNFIIYKLYPQNFQSKVFHFRHLLYNGQTTYEAAGVNIAAGNELIRNLKDRIESTFGDGGISPIGSFGAVLDLRLKSDYIDPALVSGCDGVGTKLKVKRK